MESTIGGAVAGTQQRAFKDGLNRLQERAFGGEDVAAKPSTEDDVWWPRAALLPGVQEAIDRFIANGSPDTALEVVFLMGGAGNGKSFAARELGDRLGLKKQEGDALARRLYSELINGVQYHLMNDATIAPSEDYGNQEVALAEDLTSWWRASQEISVRGFCCVNRGIIADEIRALQEAGSTAHPLALPMLRWLANPSVGEDHFGQVGAHDAFSPRANTRHAAHQIEFVLDGRQIRLIALAVDSHSLFELRDDASSRAQALFSELVRRFDAARSERPNVCPIRANIEQWQSSHGLKSWQELMSCAEIASGRLYSYRDVWGAAALSILGPRISYGSTDDDLLDHVDQLLEVATGGADLRVRLAALIALSKLRAHSALFRAPLPTLGTGTEYPPATPIHAGLALVDPAVWRSADSRSVEAAMQRVAMGEQPSLVILPTLPSQAAWSPFDELLEKTLLEFVETPHCGDVERRRLVSWYGAYLARLVSIAKNSYGNAEVINEWRRCKRSCATEPAPLPSKLEWSIRTLIFPSHPDGPANSMLMPAFSVRAEPISSFREQVQPKLVEVVPVSAVSLKVKPQGSRLLIECFIAGNADPIGQLVLDFALVREAQAFRQGRVGQTESTAYIEPRIERCRSSSMAAIDRTQRKLSVVANGAYEDLA